MRAHELEPIFVEYIPKAPEIGKLYISERFGTAVHICACGWCGEKVVTPLSPVEWRVSKEGAFISLYPSIGNWNLPCRSHYWIRRNKISWASSLTDAQIRAVQHKDLQDKYDYVAESNRQKESISGLTDTAKGGPSRSRLLGRFWKWLKTRLWAD